MTSPYPAAQALLIVGVLYIFYIYVRPVLEMFADLSISPAEETKGLLVEQDELPPMAPSVREELMRIDPKFIENLMDIEKETIEIMGNIVTTVAGLLASEAQDRNIDAYRQEAIQYITKETGGTTPKFCTKERLDRAFDGDSSKGLTQLQNCLPARPAKYLILLSYAAKVYMKQLRESRESLGGAYSGTGAIQGGPDMEMPSFAAPQNDNGTARLPPEGFRCKAAYPNAEILPAEGFRCKAAYPNAEILPAEGFRCKAGILPAEGFQDSASGSLYYSSSYALSTPQREEAPISPSLKTPFENAADAWIAAYDADALKQIRAYIRYCKWARKETAAIRSDSESGAIANKIQLPPSALPSASSLPL
jgi:hypothetical protein